MTDAERIGRLTAALEFIAAYEPTPQPGAYTQLLAEAGCWHAARNVAAKALQDPIATVPGGRPSCQALVAH